MEGFVEGNVSGPFTSAQLIERSVPLVTGSASPPTGEQELNKPRPPPRMCTVEFDRSAIVTLDSLSVPSEAIQVIGKIVVGIVVTIVHLERRFEDIRRLLVATKLVGKRLAQHVQLIDEVGIAIQEAGVAGTSGVVEVVESRGKRVAAVPFLGLIPKVTVVLGKLTELLVVFSLGPWIYCTGVPSKRLVQQKRSVDLVQQAVLQERP